MRAPGRYLSPVFVLVSMAAFGGKADPRALVEDAAGGGADVDEDIDAEAGVEGDAPGGAGVDGAGPPAIELRRGTHHTGCPSTMARVGDYCIDHYEAPNARGAKPLVMQTASDAEEWCERRHKRLCTEDEWIGACEGEEKRAYPYGDSHEDGRCNDDKTWRTVDEAVLARWPDDDAKQHTEDLYQAERSGSKQGCVSEDGVYDLTGNVEEWVQRTRAHANNYAHILIGCYWSGCYGGGKPTCHSTNNAHGPEFRFYETGFRCCRDAKKPSERAKEK